MGCTYSVQGPGEALASGGTVQVQVTAPAGCAWTAASGDNWIPSSSGGSGTGSGSVALQVAANTTAVPRTGTLSVAGTTVNDHAGGRDGCGGSPILPRRGRHGPAVRPRRRDRQPQRVGRHRSLVTFLREDGTTVAREMEVGALARLTIHVNAIPELATGPVSTVVESTAGLPLVVERTMVWNGEGYGGHSGTAVDGPQARWYFAEGSQGFFDTYLLLANPGSRARRVTVTFLHGRACRPSSAHVDVAATSRFDALRRQHARTGQPVVLDRGRLQRADHRRAGHVLVASRARSGPVATSRPACPHRRRDGCTPKARRAPFFDTYILLANPNSQATQARLTYLLPNGSTVVKLKDLPAQSRTTVFVDGDDRAPGGHRGVGHRGCRPADHLRARDVLAGRALAGGAQQLRPDRDGAAMGRGRGLPGRSARARHLHPAWRTPGRHQPPCA